MTPSEWLINNLIERDLVRNDSYIKSFLNASLLQAKEKEEEKRKEDMVKLLRWVLKNYETTIDIDAMFCWGNAIGEEFNSIDLVEKYLKFNK
jgi:hypothetical protein